MSKWDKLLKKILSLSKDVRFDEVKRVLEHYDYEMKQPHGGSSHATFRKPGFKSVTITTHDPMKTIYLYKVKKIIEGEEKNEQK